MFENLDWTVIVTAVLGLVSVVAGTFWFKVQGKLGQVVTTAKEFVDVAEAFQAAVSDNSVSKEEIEVVKKEFAEAKAAFKALIGKE